MRALDKKAQGAMEYLMTYAWAILIIIVVGVVLWSLGIFGGGSKVNTARGFTKIRILDPSIRYLSDETVDALEFTVVNAAGQKISSLQLTAINGSCEEVSSTAGKDLNSELSAGESDHIWLTDCVSRSEGEQFAVHLTFEYATTVAGRRITHGDSGDIRGSAE